MTERTRFILEWERRWHDGEGRVDVGELGRAFGVSRPHTSPYAVAEEVRDLCGH